MKKLLFLFVALLSFMASQAQVSPWRIDPNGSQILPRPMMRKAPIAPNSNQMWWGYYSGEAVSGLGTGKAETFDVAIFIPQNHEVVGNSTIKALRFYLNKKSVVNDLKLWISTSLPTSVDDADYVQPVDMSEVSSGANDVALTEPYNVSGKAIYVGYSFTLSSADYAVIQGGDYVDNSLYIRSSKSVPEWGGLSSYGKLALQLLVESSTLPSCKVTPSSFGPAAVQLGGTVDVPVEITNSGKEEVESISYTITANGQTSAERTVAVSPTISYGGKGQAVITFSAAQQIGIVANTLTVTKVNGQPNTAAQNSSTGNIQTVTELKEWPRTVLIEEFTTEYCGYCPEAAQTLASTMTTYPEIAARVALICHHVGYYTDWLTIDADGPYTWFYNDGGSTYAPAFMWDRYTFSGKTPVTDRPSNAANCKNIIEERLKVASKVRIDLKAVFSETKDKIYVTATCERGMEFCNTPARLTLTLTEDNITAHSQSGAKNGFIHQHVSRAVNSTWGEVLNWNNDKASYVYTFDVNAEWKTEDLKVVAFVSGYDRTDPTNCVVENTAVTTISEPGQAPGDKGDVNGDGAVNVADIATVIDVMSGKVTDAAIVSAADVNGDEAVNVADISAIIDIMAGKGGDTQPDEKVYTSCPDGNHPHIIDLGLPSGTKWACCNVGAKTPEEYGDYFAWGETEPKEVYDWETYIHCDGSQETCHDIGSDIAGKEYDAATANWKAPWRTPTIEQFQELIDNCTSEWTSQNDVEGRLFTGTNGGTIFLPAAGARLNSDLIYAGGDGYYHSSTLVKGVSYYAWCLWIDSGYVDKCTCENFRRNGLTVRPVR